MKVKEIIIKKLKELGADGLCYINCGCSIDDLCPCGSDCLECVPAKLVKCKECEYEDFRPLAEKEKQKTNHILYKSTADLFGY